MFVIRNLNDGCLLSGVGIGSRNVIDPTSWCFFKSLCIQFEAKEEAEATIQFIGDVIDFELSEGLEIEEI